ncbi:MAG: SRPBCC family protein [Actinomycetota bacterium]
MMAPDRLEDDIPTVHKTREFRRRQAAQTHDAGGLAIVEALLEEGNLTHTYEIVEGPMPFTNYRSTLSVQAKNEESCVVDWQSTFDSAEGSSEADAAAVVEMIYDAGLDGMSMRA